MTYRAWNLKPLDRAALRELTQAIAEQATEELEYNAQNDEPWSEQKYAAALAAQQKENALLAGVLTARGHVVLGGTDQATDTRTLPSAAVFLRHTPDSPVVNLVAKIRELTSKAVPDLDYERVSVMLVPVREQVSVPMEPTPKFLGLPLAPQNGPPYALIGAGIVFLAALAGLALLALSLRDALRKRKEAANASEDQSS